jgi:hypothetical protein
VSEQTYRNPKTGLPMTILASSPWDRMARRGERDEYYPNLQSSGLRRDPIFARERTMTAWLNVVYRVIVAVTVILALITVGMAIYHLLHH